MKTIIIYYSKTGFTEKYAKLISEKINCKIISYQNIKKEKLNEYDTIIFGSRIIAGTIQKLKNIKKLAKKNNIKKLIIFTTGSTPNKAKEVLEEMWSKNLTQEEMKSITHFHMQSGMNLDKLPKIEKIMINMAKKMINSKKNKTEEDKEFEKAISNSFDISNEKYTEELIEYIKNN